MTAKSLQDAGPLLNRLLQAQNLEEKVVRYEQIELIADAVVARAEELQRCLVWPLGPAAERVAGVVTVRSKGTVEVGDWNTVVKGRRLLLFAVAGVSPLALQGAAEQLRRRGAVEVHACGVGVAGADTGLGLNSYAGLGISPSQSSLVLIGDAA